MEFREPTWWVNIVIGREKSKSQCFCDNARFYTKWSRDKSESANGCSPAEEELVSPLCVNPQTSCTRRILPIFSRVTTRFFLMASCLYILNNRYHDHHQTPIKLETNKSCSSQNSFSIPLVIVTIVKCHM